MANTIMTAKNTFAEGLVMDFAPDNTQATTLTSALNATLLTFNGNEMSLQNDMGNGRVETAYLQRGMFRLELVNLEILFIQYRIIQSLISRRQGVFLAQKEI